MGFNDWQSTSTFEVSGAPLMTLENRGERITKKKKKKTRPERNTPKNQQPNKAPRKKLNGRGGKIKGKPHKFWGVWGPPEDP